jgi:hypothetical protein
MGANNIDAELGALMADHEFFAKSGMMPINWNEVRRFPRFYLRGPAEGLIYPVRGELGDSPTPVPILTSDISRSGVGLISPKQLFPEQRVDIRMPEGGRYSVKVMWCRRMEADRYAAGCVFVEA